MLCWINVPSTSVDNDLHGQFVFTVGERFQGKYGPAWKIIPHVYSKRLKTGVESLIEKFLVPVSGPYKEDVKDTLEVMAMLNNKSFSALSELAKTKVKEGHYGDYKPED
jgi:hypothetical protein